MFPEGLTSIYGSAFGYCTSLGDLLLPTSLESIAPYCFTNANITSISWVGNPKTLSVGSYAFYSVKGLKTIKAPSAWTTINDYTFAYSELETIDFTCVSDRELVICKNSIYECKSLYSATFPKNIKSIGEYAFCKSGLTSIKLPNITEIGKSAFNGTRIAEIVWPEDPIQKLGSNVFSENPVQSISFPTWLKDIPEQMFEHCENLSDITLHEGIETIGNSAFSRCAITSLVIPESIRQIGNNAFESNKISSLTLPKPNDATAYNPLELFGGCVFKDNQLKQFESPAWLTILPNGIFSNNLLTNFKFANGISEIHSSALASNPNLIIGNFPKTITHFGSYCLQHGGSKLTGSDYLGRVFLGDGVVVDDYAFESARIEAIEFSGCDFTLGNNIFSNVTTIKEIDFPDCMEEIPAGFCRGWASLTRVGWPESLKSIGDYAFNGCPLLIFGYDENGKGNVFDFTKYPYNKLTHIGRGAFQSTYITDVVWPESGENIKLDGYTFANTRLTIAKIPGWMDNIPDGLYYENKSINDIYWEESDRTNLNIGEYAFYCVNINTITWPDVPTHIGNNAFSSCKATRIEWPESITTLGTGCFSYCRNLAEPTAVPNYITKLPESTFRNCTSLREFTLHEGITSVGDMAFISCDGMEHFKIEGNVSVISPSCFSYCSQLKDFTALHPIIRFERYSFNGCESLVELNLANTPSESLENIGHSAFGNCKSLKEFPDVISQSTTIERYAFNGAESLTHIIYPFNNSDSYSTFSNCSDLQSITIYPTDGSLNMETETTFANTPLLGVSYLDGEVKTLRNSYPGEDRGQKGILMVGRGQKWKLHQQKINNIWDIRELPSPNLQLVGDITSEFKPGDHVNHYKAVLRWEIAESDLNPSAPTVYHLKRDGVEVSAFEFSTPHIETKVNDGNINVDGLPLSVYDVKVRRPGHEAEPMTTWHDQFYYQSAENEFSQILAYQHSALYFNNPSSRREGRVDQLGGSGSWFMFVDEFDSPDLNGTGVPDHYTYTLEIEPYTYRLPVNNDGYLQGDDGLYYHFEDATIDVAAAAETAEPCVVHTSMAVPSLKFDGLYTLDEIMTDTEAQLPVSDQLTADGAVALQYAFANPTHVNHKLHNDKGMSFIINSITAYEIPSRTYPTAENEWTTITIQGKNAEGEMVVPAEKNPRKGSSFQIVTNAGPRGTFGSRIVSIPGAPALSLDVSPLSFTDHGHERLAVCDVKLEPLDTDLMGYDELTPLTADRHMIGVWRQRDDQFVSPANLTDESSDPLAEAELAHHLGRNTVESWNCGICDANHIYDGDTYTYADHFEVGDLGPSHMKQVTSIYKVRMYVQTPDDPSKWMIAEATGANSGVATGIDEVRNELVDGEIRFYNLQGQRIEEPARGQIVIKISASGAEKLRY